MNYLTNELTGRLILINGPTHKRLLREGVVFGAPQTKTLSGTDAASKKREQRAKNDLKWAMLHSRPNKTLR